MRYKYAHACGPFKMLQLEDMEGAAEGIAKLDLVADQYLSVLCGSDHCILTVCGGSDSGSRSNLVGCSVASEHQFSRIGIFPKTLQGLWDGSGSSFGDNVGALAPMGTHIAAAKPI